MKESVPNQKGTNEGHAEKQSTGAAEAGRKPGDPITTVVDQVPCARCDPQLHADLPPGSKVYVPRAVGQPAPPRSVEPNPNKISVKNWAEQAARGQITVEPHPLIKIPKSFGQHWSDTPKGLLAPARPDLLPPGPPSGPGSGQDSNRPYYQLQLRF